MSKYHGKATVNKVNKTISTSPVFLQFLRKCSGIPCFYSYVCQTCFYRYIWQPVDLFPPKDVIKFSTLEYCNNLSSGTKVIFIIGQSRHMVQISSSNVPERRLWPDFEVVLLACPNNFCSLGSLLTVTVMALSGAVCKYM